MNAPRIAALYVPKFPKIARRRLGKEAQHEGGKSRRKKKERKEGSERNVRV